MSIIHKRRECIWLVDSGFNIVTLLFIAIDVCIASTIQYNASPNEKLSESTIVPNKNTGERIETTNVSNILFDDSIYNEDFIHLNNADTNNLTTAFGPYLALSSFHGHLDPGFVALINPFWLKFNPAPANAHYVLGIIHSCIMVIGLFGNALVIFMFIKCRSIRTPCNTLIINLAISDFFMLLKAPIVIYNSFKLGPALGEFVCRIYGFIGGLTGTASIATLTAISIDRYNVVVYPLEPLRSTTRRRCNIMVLVVWCYSLTFSLVPALNIGYSKYVPEGYLTSCSFDYLDKTLKARIFMFVFFVFAWCVPFTIITHCYIYILKVVMSSRHIRSSLDKQKTDIKLSIIVIGVIILWFVAWTPYSIVALLGISGNEDKISPFASMIPAVFCKASACIDPYVYAITHPRFRMEFRRMFLGRDEIGRAKTSYYQCNTTVNPSIKRKRIVSDINVVNNFKFQENNLRNKNSLREKDIECETNFSIRVKDSQNENDKNEVVVVGVETHTDEVNVVIDVVEKSI